MPWDLGCYGNASFKSGSVDVNHVQTDTQSILYNNNNTNANVYSAVTMTRPLREFTQFIRWMQTKCQAAVNPQTKPSTWAVSPPVGCHHLHPPSSFIIITQPESWCWFYHPTEGRRLSQPGGWLQTQMIYPLVYVTHPSINWVQHRETTLIKTNALPLSPATRYTWTANVLVCHFFVSVIFLFHIRAVSEFCALIH